MAVDQVGFMRRAQWDGTLARGEWSEYSSYLEMNAAEDGMDGAEVMLVWHAVYGKDVNLSWDFALNWQELSDVRDSFGPWQTSWETWENVSADKIAATTVPGRGGTYYAVSFGWLCRQCHITSPDVWSMCAGRYAGRERDAMRFGVHVKSHVFDGSVSPRTDSELMLAYSPDYNIGNVWWRSAGMLAIGYSAEGWKRGDDRYEVVELGGAVAEGQRPWGTVNVNGGGGGGIIFVPVEKMVEMPVTGEPTKVSVRFNASWNAVGASWATVAEKTAVIPVHEVYEPAVKAELMPDGRVKATVTNKTTSGIRPDSYTVKVSGDGSAFPFDAARIVGGAGGVVYFENTPMGRVKVSAVAHETTMGKSSKTAEDHVDVPMEGRYVVVPMGGGERRVPRYNVELSDKLSRDVELVKFAGRARESAFYAEGGERTLSLSFDVPRHDIGDGAAPHDEQLRAWDGLMGERVCIMWHLDGSRTAVCVTDVDHKRGYNTGKTSVDVTMKEVDL